MEDLFLPSNLVLNKDGSVSPKDFYETLPLPEENESFTEYGKRINKIISNLKDYERDMYIPIEQKKMLYEVIFFRQLVYITPKDEQQGNHLTETTEVKYFPELKRAKEYAKNHIKQKTIACLNIKNKRYYKYSFMIIHNNFVIEEDSAKRGKLI